MSLLSSLQLSTKTVFTSQDLKQIWKDIPANQIKQYVAYHVKRGNLRRIQRGLFALPGREPDPLELGNCLRSPSYISFETVLLREGILFQWDSSIRLASYESRQFLVDGISFQFSQLKPEILLSAQGLIQHPRYLIACKERALLDCMYMQPAMYFDNLRNIDFSLVRSLLGVYQQDSLKIVVDRWEAHVGSL